jgi:hypothetical protein
MNSASIIPPHRHTPALRQQFLSTEFRRSYGWLTSCMHRLVIAQRYRVGAGVPACLGLHERLLIHSASATAPRTA